MHKRVSQKYMFCGTIVITEQMMMDAMNNEKYQLEKDSIISDNKALHDNVDKFKCEYKNKSIELKFDYKDKYERLETKNNKLHDIIDRFYITIVLFIKWLCNKFALGDSRKIIRDYQRDNNICIDPVKQIANEQEDEEET